MPGTGRIPVLRRNFRHGLTDLRLLRQGRRKGAPVRFSRIETPRFALVLEML